MPQTAGMETDDLQAQLSHLQQLVLDEEQKQRQQKVQTTMLSFVFIPVNRYGYRRQLLVVTSTVSFMKVNVLI